ncbi:MAG: gliding motility-associated C-terminal domain-containing protein [Bacteroidetes bacterium]|nr:gliding motility-associated C-terminal domain-containing protein [Bacteroidota bacterium]
MKRICVLILFFICLTALKGFATHLMGGNLYYTYTGINGGNGYSKFDIELKLYRYCAPGSSQMPSNFTLAVYENDSAAPNANKILYNTYIFPLASQQFITPPNANDTCAFLPNECVEEGIYTGSIEVPPSTGGYHLLMERCCRNQNIVNVFNPGDVGMVFYAFIPPTTVTNNSPQFQVAPVPYICAFDTVSILNSAVDPDGDILEYKFVTPYAGISSGNSPNPTMPSVYSWPIDTVTYDLGFSSAQPFGVGGYQFINSSTGLTSYLSPNTGFYVVAVEIIEWRNGIIVGKSRRDLQLIFITCPINPAPVLSAQTQQINYTVQAGQQLCFNITFNDPNGDSVFFNSSGNIFNGAFFNPPATLAPAVGLATVTSTFCWTPACTLNSAVPYNFSVSTNDNGCPPKITNIVYSITVVPFVSNIQISGADSICAGALNNIGYTTNGNNGSTYTWVISGGAITNGQGTNSIFVDWGQVGPYILTVTEISASGCLGQPVTKNIYVKPSPTASAGVDKTFCSGATVTLGSSAANGVTYTWNPANGLSNSAISNPSITLANATQAPITSNYTVTANLNGCLASDTVTLTINPTAVSNAGTNQFFCSGDTINLGTQPTNGYTYSWTPATGLSSTTISNPTLQLINNGSAIVYATYYVVTNNTYNCPSSDSVTVGINPLPVVLSSANPDTVCAGKPVVLNATGASSYNWANANNPGTSIGIGSSITVNPTITTTYIVTGTSASNCENTSSITVVVNPLPAIVAFQNPDTICQGDSSLISVSGGNSYAWALLTAPNQVINTGVSFYVSPMVTTSYIATGTNLNGCENKDTVTIHVNPTPVLTTIIGTLSVCPGITGLTYYLPNGNTSSTYNWTITGGTIVSGQGNDSILVNWGPTGIGVISVIEVSDKGCVSEDIGITISINPELEPAIPFGDTALCANEAFGITYSCLQTPGSTYNWYTSNGTIVSGNGTNSVTVNWNIAGPATVYIWYQEQTTADTICSGWSDTLAITLWPVPQTSAISASPEVCIYDTTSFAVLNSIGNSYFWNAVNGNISIGQSTNQMNAYWTASGLQQVQVIETNSFGCKDTADYTILVNPLPNANAGNDTSVCSGFSTNLLATGGITYSWSPGTGLSNASIPDPVATPNVTTTYAVLVTDTNGCKKFDSVMVVVNPLPVVVTIANPPAICIGDSSQLSASGGATYQWSPSNYLNNVSIANPYASPPVSSTYLVTVTDTKGCSSSSSITIVVNPLPIISTNNDQIICNGSSFLLTALGGVTYQWSPPGGLSSVTGQSVSASPSQPTLYIVTGTDANGCQNTDSVFIDINPQPKANFSIQPDISCKGVSIQFENLSADALNFEWQFGDNTASSDINPVHFYQLGQQAFVQLIAYNNFCSDTIILSNNVLTLSGYLDSTANVFTPNGDLINDCFGLPLNTKFEDCMTMYVFDRWGVLMFESNASSKCWNGKNKQGNDVPTGTYYYKIRVESSEAFGALQLLRN